MDMVGTIGDAKSGVMVRQQSSRERPSTMIIGACDERTEREESRRGADDERLGQRGLSSVQT